jgi:hypothetical protein
VTSDAPPETRLRERLGALVEAGAGRFDPEGAACIAALLDRARELGGGASVRLAARAEARLEALEAALLGACARAEPVLVGLEGPVAAEARALLASGDAAAAINLARRTARRARARAAAARAALRLTRLRERLVSDAAGLADRGALAALDARELVHVGDRVRAQADGNALSHALFHRSAAAARAALAVERADDDLPADAGPYNAHVLAAKALRALATLSPAYVRALVAELDDLAELDAALAPFAPEPPRRGSGPPTRTRRPRSGPSGRGS